MKEIQLGFEYILDDKKRRYYPDFIINDTYIEIKGCMNDKVQAKFDQFPKDLKLKILFKKDMEIYLTYAKEKYGENYWELLTETNKQ